MKYRFRGRIISYVEIGGVEGETPEDATAKARTYLELRFSGITNGTSKLELDPEPHPQNEMTPPALRWSDTPFS